MADSSKGNDSGDTFDELVTKSQKMMVDGVSNAVDNFAKKVEELGDLDKQVEQFEHGMKTVGRMFQAFFKD